MVNKWIEWKGGECPVPAGTLVDVLDGDGTVWEGAEAIPFDGRFSNAGAIFWEHRCMKTNAIAAWRLHQPEQEAWGGEGHPPVGTECELLFCENWNPVIIKFVGEKYVVAERTDLGCEVVYCIAGMPERFRPIRTEAERKRDEFINQLMKELLFLGHDREQAGSLYDAIAAGKIPGVKLED